MPQRRIPRPDHAFLAFGKTYLRRSGFGLALSNPGRLRGPWVAQFARACFIARRARQFEMAMPAITPKPSTTTATDNQMSKPGSPAAERSFPEVVRESGNEGAAASMWQKAASLHRLNQQFAERLCRPFTASGPGATAAGWSWRRGIATERRLTLGALPAHDLENSLYRSHSTITLPMDFELLLISSIVANGIVSAVVAWAASQRNRSAFGWFLISFFCSPILAGILLLVVGPGRSGRGSSGQWNPQADMSNLSDDDLAVVQKHYADQRARAANRPDLPPRVSDGE